MVILILSKVNLLIYIEDDELWEFDIDTNKLNPILDLLTIVINIGIILKIDIILILIIMIIKIDNTNNSRLNRIKIIFFRHQHILEILIITMIFINVI